MNGEIGIQTKKKWQFFLFIKEARILKGNCRQSQKKTMETNYSCIIVKAKIHAVVNTQLRADKVIICPKNSLNPASGTLSAAAIVEKNQGHPDDGLEGCDTLEAYGQAKVK